MASVYVAYIVRVAVVLEEFFEPPEESPVPLDCFRVLAFGLAGEDKSLD